MRSESRPSGRIRDGFAESADVEGCLAAGATPWPLWPDRANGVSMADLALVSVQRSTGRSRWFAGNPGVASAEPVRRSPRPATRLCTLRPAPYELEQARCRRALDHGQAAGGHRWRQGHGLRDCWLLAEAAEFLAGEPERGVREAAVVAVVSVAYSRLRPLKPKGGPTASDCNVV